jgi:hypothetical protein
LPLPNLLLGLQAVAQTFKWLGDIIVKPVHNAVEVFTVNRDNYDDRKDADKNIK